MLTLVPDGTVGAGVAGGDPYSIGFTIWVVEIMGALGVGGTIGEGVGRVAGGIGEVVGVGVNGVFLALISPTFVQNPS